MWQSFPLNVFIFRTNYKSNQNLGVIYYIANTITVVFSIYGPFRNIKKI